MVIPKDVLAFYRDNRTDYPVTVILEVSGPDPLTDQLLGVYLAGEQDSFVYWGVGPDSSDGERAKAAGMLGSYPLVMFNAARCCTWLTRIGVEPQVAGDPMLAAFVIDPNQPLDLQTLSAKYLDNPYQPLAVEPVEAGIVQRLSGMLLQEPIDPMAIAIRSLFEKVRDLPDWASPVYDQELALAPVIARMEIVGITVDSAQLESIASALAHTSSALEAKLTALSAGF